MTVERPAIEARSLRFAYDVTPVLDGVSVSVAPRELVAVVGPNGAGKSTLLRVLLGFLERASGDVTLSGTPLDALSRREIARRAAFVPQGFRTDFAFRVREMVAMGRTPHLGRFEPEGPADRAAIARAMEATGVAPMAQRAFTELSGGEQQRVLLARAFAQDTRLLVLDEPNASLDLLHAHELMTLVRRRTDGGASAVAALHDLSLAARFCDRLVVLSRGRVHADGPPGEVLTEDLMREVWRVSARILRQDGALLVDVRGPAIRE